MVLAKIDLFFIIIYFLIVLLIGYISSKRETKEEFLIGGRKLTKGFMPTVMASLIGGTALVTFTGYVYEFGFAAFFGFFGLLFGFLIFIPYAKRIKRLSDKFGFYTFADYFNHKYGKSVGYLVSFVMFLSFLFSLGIQFIAGSKVLSAVSGFSYYWSLILVSIVILIYLLLGGFKAVVKTDFFQFLVIILIAVLAGFFVFSANPGDLNFGNYGGISFVMILAFLIYGIQIPFSGADHWQRVYAAKNNEVIKKGLIKVGIITLVLGVFITAIGLIAKSNFPNIEADQAIVYGFSHLLPPGLFGLGLVILFAAIMSSADTQIFVLSSSIAQDWVAKRRKLSKENLIKVTKVSMLIITIVAVIFSIFFQDLIKVLMAMGSINLALFPVIVGSFHFRLKRKAVMLSIISGLVFAFGLLISGYVTPQTAVSSFPIALVFLLIGQKVFK